MKESFGNGDEAPVPLNERAYAFLDRIEPEQKNEGFQTSAGVQYVARAGRYAEDGSPVLGTMQVLRTIMNYEYLWFNIRVQGGAYGCMFNAARNGICL